MRKKRRKKSKKKGIKIKGTKTIVFRRRKEGRWKKETKRCRGEKRDAVSKDENIGFDEYIGTWILRIYRRYIDEYFYINIDISKIKPL